MKMLNLFSKYFLLLFMLLFSLLSLFLNDLILIWFFIEISNFLFICLMNNYMLNKKSIFFYFFIQIMASFLMIFSFIINNIFIYNNYIKLMIMFSLLLKLSIPPFHLWLPVLSIYTPWNILLLILTIQKITPFYIWSLIKINIMLIYFFIILCSIIPPFMMMKLTNLKILMSYSSINQSSWMIMLMYMKNIIWFKYFICYSFIMLNIFILYNLHKIFMNFNYKNYYFNIFILIYMLNMAGMPPFTFFFIKWYSMFIFMYNSNLFFILILMMLSSLLMLFIYINMMINSLFIFSYKSKLMNLMLNMNFYNIFMFFLGLIFSSFIMMI
uniref:NADH-ubiquinone oxidoreductase chain 2 n=1 Tax=Myrmica scabrinodis TaxID=207696 RepID=A0A0A8P140_9HYME|nr:NADH dehydrogenase subunit 2 [Myrmica scabrinodis]CEF49553.1 NADH dehydrogenase subunit 2 [Myrmica scabrinodis]